MSFVGLADLVLALAYTIKSLLNAEVRSRIFGGAGINGNIILRAIVIAIFLSSSFLLVPWGWRIESPLSLFQQCSLRVLLIYLLVDRSRSLMRLPIAVTILTISNFIFAAMQKYYLKEYLLHFQLLSLHLLSIYLTFSRLPQRNLLE